MNISLNIATHQQNPILLYLITHSTVSMILPWIQHHPFTNNHITLISMLSKFDQNEEAHDKPHSNHNQSEIKCALLSSWTMTALTKY